MTVFSWLGYFSSQLKFFLTPTFGTRSQRELYPYPFVLINTKDAAEKGILEGDWVEISSPRAAIKAKAQVSEEIGVGVIALPRPGWRADCKQLNLKGYNWDEVGINALLPGGEGTTDPGFSSAPMRSTLCQIKRLEDCDV